MDEQKIPYIAYESVLARHERTVKRLIISICLAVLLIVISNVCWLYAWCQYDYESEETTTSTTTVQQDGKGQNVYGDNNSVNNGSKGHNNGKTQTQKKTEEKR